MGLNLNFTHREATGSIILHHLFELLRNVVADNAESCGGTIVFNDSP